MKVEAMTNSSLDRRNLLTSAALVAASVSVATTVTAQTAAAPTTVGKAFTPEPRPLPFDPKTIPGLSEKLLVSHHDNNYVSAVKRLGAISTQFAALDPAAAQNFNLNGLKREELLAWNSMILHELYFSCLGAPNRPGAALASAIERDFGSDSRWRAEFSGMGKALGGGSGWVILNWSHRDNRLVNQWANDHTMTLAGGTPILAMDMYEHAYAIDFGSAAARYVDAFMAATNWSSADKNFAKASAA
jgi:Fe-Mn family superoxide dismutase